MNKPEVNWEICQACEPCDARSVCKVKAILKIDPGEPVFIEPSLCNNCHICLPACTYGAIPNTRIFPASQHSGSQPCDH